MTASGFQKLKEQVIDANLCTRCGGCVGVCREQAIIIDDVMGEALPRLNGTCDSCDGRCYDACSGDYVPFPSLNEFVFGQQPTNRYLGNYQSISVGFASDAEVRAQGASGGVLTAVLLYLLAKGLVDGAIVTRSDPQQPWLGKPFIARTPTEIKQAAQSKYAIIPVNAILQEVEKLDGKFAYVGLPCQVHSLRKLQQSGNVAAQKISVVLGSYCGINMHFESVRSFLRAHGVQDVEQVARLEYRAGEWPGKMRAQMTDGRVFELEKFYANYLIPFFVMQRCLTCTDLTNEFADIVGGDAWSPVYEERGKGWSLVVSRTQTGQNLLNAMLEDSALSLQPTDEHDAMTMHSHMLDFKKRGAFLRMQRLRRLGKATPRYDYEPLDIPFKRQLFEWAIDFIFWAGRFRLIHRIVERIPIRWTGRIFMAARDRWKKMTYRAKREDMHLLRFRYTLDGITYEDSTETSRE